MIEVRRAQPRDGAAMVEILNAIIAQGGTTAMQTVLEPCAFDDLVTGRIARACVHVAVAAGQTVGFQYAEPHPSLPDNTAQIATFVRIGTTRGGIGSALFPRTRAECIAMGYAEIDATIRADNTGGLKYYSRMDFCNHAVTRAVALDDGAPVDRIHKRLKL